MRVRKLNCAVIFFLLGCLSQVQAQNKLHFADITIKAATQRANIENKNIFVDTYAPWCGPCKIMDIHFQDKEVINYFNRNFINVKIDTDTPYGKKVSAKYQIAFLPTILILDKDGATRFKVDKLINRDELLSLARYAIDGPPQESASSLPPSPPKEKISPPKKEMATASKKPTPTTVAKKKEISIAETPDVEEVSDEKILYVLDKNATDLPPEILYEEAYFRMQFHDGSHKGAAKKYLASQDNWDTEKNLKFIFDFLYDTDSEEFEYFIANREKFQAVISDQKINRSLKILIENKLYQGIPRPDFERSKYLLSLIDLVNGEKNNYHYFLNRLFEEEKANKFLELSEVYFKKYEHYNQDIVLKYLKYKLSDNPSKGKLKGFVQLLETIENPTENYPLLLTYSKIYFALSDKEKATSSAIKAIDVGQDAKIDVKEAKLILENVEEL